MQVNGVEHVVMAVLMLLAYQPLLKLVERHVGLPAGEQHKKMEMDKPQWVQVIFQPFVIDVALLS